MTDIKEKVFLFGGKKVCISNALDVDVVAEVNQEQSGLIVQRLKRSQDS